MRADWPLVKLDDVVDLVTGYPFQSKLYSDDGKGIRLLRGDNVVQGVFRWGNVKLLPEKELNEKHEPYWLHEDDVILAMDRPWIEAGLKFAQITKEDLPCLLVQRVASLRGNEKLDTDYLKYIISSYGFTEYVKLVQTGTAVPHISGKQILGYEFYLPPKNVQEAIGRVLKSIDCKCAINHRVNQTLEQIAQAIFKSWFVDFEPVKAKIEAKQNGQDPERAAMCAISGRDDADLDQLPADQLAQLAVSAALFPDELMNSKLGLIPKGWKNLPLSEMVQLIGGGTPKRSIPEYWSGRIPWFSVQDTPADGDVFAVEAKEKITKVGLEKSSTKLLPIGTTIISARGTVGRLALTGVKMAMNQSCYGVRGIEAIGPYFNYFNLKESVNALQQNTHGAVFDTITRKTFETVACINPKAPLLDVFEKTVSSLMANIRNNLYERSSLATIRDTLLPKLLSGEIEVK